MTYNRVHRLGGKIAFGDEVASKLLGSRGGDRARRTESLQSERLYRRGVVQKQFVDSITANISPTLFHYEGRWECITPNYDEMGSPSFTSSPWTFRTRQTGTTGMNECSAISFFIDFF